MRNNYEDKDLLASKKKKRLLRGNMIDVYKVISGKVKVNRYIFSTLPSSTELNLAGGDSKISTRKWFST